MSTTAFDDQFALEPPATFVAVPIPQALILTGIVVAVSTTALALSLIVRVWHQCGTIEADELRELE